MADPVAQKLLLVADAVWCTSGEARAKSLRTKHSLVLSDRHSRIVTPSKQVSLKFRSRGGDVRVDDEVHLHISDGPHRVTLHSHKFASDLLERDLRDQLLFVLLEQADDVLRATVNIASLATLQELDRNRPELRLSAYDLPPVTVTELEPSISRDGMDADSLFAVLTKLLEQKDPALFAAHTERFLNAPHIVVPLLNHLASLTAEDNLKFPVQLKRLADQFRAILEMEGSPIGIKKLERNHLDTWADAQGHRYAFVDGGVAKIAGLPGTEPTALRVGIYAVRAGDTSKDRERWELCPFVVGDIIDKNTGVIMEEGQQMDLRRLGEAARYTLEPLTALKFVERHSEVKCVFMHGPLINQFVQYDEGEPHFIPYLKEDFLARTGVQKDDVEAVVKEIPRGIDGRPMWRQFMAIYGYIAARIFASDVPFVGVVERSAGTWLAQAVLDGAVEARIVTQAYKNKVMSLLARYSISDDFLFGCVLAEGEYISPTAIPKNSSHRAREKWKQVVAAYPKPFASVLKTTEFSFPFRVELNSAGRAQEAEVMRLLYHTARLLPRYAFPVGLDIVDKYAKVPAWLSKNISARLAASVLNRAMAEGDAKVVAQVRQLLAHAPRDFFYRPKVD